MSLTDVWNEAYPAGSTPGNELDTAITQGVKRALRERLQVDHDIRSNESGAEENLIPTGTIGYHKKVTLTERASDPTQVANAGILYVKDDAGDTELYYLDDSGNIIQLTADGALMIGGKVVDLTGIASGDSIKYNGTKFVAGAPNATYAA